MGGNRANDTNQHQIRNRQMYYQLNVGGQHFTVEIGAQQADQLRVTVNGTPFDVTFTQPAGAGMPHVAAVARQGFLNRADFLALLKAILDADARDYDRPPSGMVGRREWQR